jgi:hypothetical protein
MKFAGALGVSLGRCMSMPEDLSSKVAHCRTEAAECRERAMEAGDPADRPYYLGMEARWLFLARSYELKEMLNPFLEEADRLRKR